MNKSDKLLIIILKHFNIFKYSLFNCWNIIINPIELSSLFFSKSNKDILIDLKIHFAINGLFDFYLVIFSYIKYYNLKIILNISNFEGNIEL